jgi:hypothetical protein
MNLRSSICFGGIVLLVIISIPILLTGPVSTNPAVQEVPPSFSSSYIVPVYNGTFDPNGSLDYNDPEDPWNIPDRTYDVPSTREAQKMAPDLLARFGGIPAESELIRAFTNHGPQMCNGTTNICIRDPRPSSTILHYQRQNVSGLPFFGDEFIHLELGDGARIEWLWKNWRTYEPAGMTCTISAETATERLVQGKFVGIEHDNRNLTITEVKLYYYNGKYAWHRTYDQESIQVLPLEPVWVFMGNDTEDNHLGIFVPAIDPVGSDVRYCSGIRAPRPTNITIILNKPVTVDTSGMITVEAAKQIAKDFVELPDATVTYNGKIRKYCGGYQYFRYNLSVGQVPVEVDKMTGNVVAADFTLLYPKATNFSVSMDQALKTAQDYAKRKYPGFSDKNPEQFLARQNNWSPTYRYPTYDFGWYNEEEEGEDRIDLYISIHPDNGKVVSYRDDSQVAPLACMYSEEKIS